MLSPWHCDCLLEYTQDVMETGVAADVVFLFVLRALLPGGQLTL